MTSDLFGIWLKELNRKMAKEKRSILLTVDNASCHNSGIELELSNVKVQFLPKITTSQFPLCRSAFTVQNCHIAL